MIKKMICLISGIMLCSLVAITCGGSSSSKSNSSDSSPNIYVDQTNIDFSGRVLNSSEPRTIIIKNIGNTNLKIGKILIPGGPFVISDDKSSNTTLGPNQTSSVTVTFTPNTLSKFNETLSIPSNDPESPAVNVTLKGEGCGLNVQINQIETSNCPQIKLNVTVTDQNGELINNLDAEHDFKLKINNSEQVCVVKENYTRPTISIVLALDLSSSLTANWSAIKTAAQNFITNKLTENDEATICKFNADINFFPSAPPLFITTDNNGKDDLIDYISDTFSGSSGTALYDAVYDSIDRAFLEGTKDRLAIIVLSDGDNNLTIENSMNDAIAYASSKEIPIFSIYYAGTSGQPQNMQSLADGTNGKYYTTETGGASDLEKLFNQITYVLTDKYTMTIPGVNCTAGSIEIEVRATTSDGLSGVDRRTIVFP
jgi:hypothetical protein